MTKARQTTQRHWARGPVLLLAFVLLWAQALGLAHRIVHGPQALAQGMALQAAADERPGHALVAGEGWLAQLFSSHHGDLDCRAYDQLGQTDAMPTMPVLVQPGLLPVFLCVAVAAAVCLDTLAPFEARGPPTVR